MPKALTALSVFLASPGDVKKERETIRNIVNAADEDLWDSRDVCLRVLRWEDAPRGLGDPQDIINEYSENADLVVVIFSERFGTATANYPSGTLEEFELARARWESRGTPQVKIFFQRPATKALKKPGEQLKQVLDFKDRFWQQRIGLYTEYKNHRDFEAKFRREFSRWLDQVTLRKDADSAPGRGLPAPVRPFVIREKDVQTVRDYLRREGAAVVTLHGVAGNGKSSLAVHAAAGLKGEYGSRLFYVDLSAAAAGQDIIPAIADALGVKIVKDVDLIKSIRENLRGGRTLLLLDHLEDVKAAAPRLALLAGSPGLKMLVTSQHPLGLAGEEKFEVQPLTYPPRKKFRSLTAREARAEYSAIELFDELMRLKEPNFKLTDGNVTTVADICEQLDGLPLAIRLAVDSIGPLALEQKSTQIKKLLRRGMTKLEAAFRSSYDTLSPTEKATFRRLSVFVDGFTPEGAMHVCGIGGGADGDGDDGPVSVIAAVESLIGQGLLQRREQPWGETRLTMLNTIREFALRRLREEETAPDRLALRRRHAAFYLDLAEKAEPLLTSGEREARSWLERLEAESENLNAVLDWSRTVEGDGELGLRLAGALFWFWNLQGSLEEGRLRAEDVLMKGADAANGLTLAKALYCLGGLSFLQGEYGISENRLRRSVELWRTFPEHKRGLGFALIVLGMTLLQQEKTKHAEARACEEEGVRIFCESGDDWGHALGLSDLGNVEKEAGRHAEAQRRYEESLTKWETVNDSWGRSLALSYLGDLAYRRGEYLTARRYMSDALRIQRARGDKWGMAWSLNMLGRIDASTPDYGQAAGHFRESLSLHAELGRKHMIAYCLEGLASVACAEGEWRRAVVLIGAAQALRQSIEAPMTPAEANEHERCLERIRAKLDAATIEDALAQGGKMSLELEGIVSYAKAE